MNHTPIRASRGAGAPALDDETLALRLTEVVTGAGDLALSMFRSGLKSWNKDNNTPVTEADLAVDHLLHEQLTELAPDCGWLSEETADDPIRLNRRRVWVVDPIDGTRGYMNGAADWAVSVALVEEGKPLMAVLFAPALEQMFVARRGDGAHRNGTRLNAGSHAGLDGARAAGPDDSLNRLARLGAITRLPRGHSLALRLARVATGEVDIALSRHGSSDWDLAAADLMVQEAGGCLTTFDAAALTYNRAVPRHPPLLCAGRALHSATLAAASAAAPPARGATTPSLIVPPTRDSP